MKIEQSTAIKLRITEVESLDPITVFLEDYEIGKGKIVIECYGKSWSSFWGAMGGRTIAQFFCSCDEGYLISNLCGALSSEEPDYDAFLPLAREHILGRRRMNLIGSSLARALYDIEDWEEYAPEHSYDTYKCTDFESEEEFEYLDFGSITVPTRVPHKYAYMVRIIEAVQAALTESGLAIEQAA